ncbi:MAG: hypothetical protein NT027_16410 [Proteobacteria bacterium]|nr:hypothetical protein [Pseudomonadota bacterium]
MKPSLNKLLNVASLVLLPLIGTATNSFAETYESLTACKKQEVLWDKYILTSKYSTLPAVTGSWSTLMGNINSLLFLDQTFDTKADFMPVGRQKVIHSHGSVAKITWQNLASSPFSGMFAANETNCGLARLSLAGSPSLLGFTPGMAIKLFVDEKPSVNFQIMEKLNGQGNNKNIFAKTFTNSLPAPTGFVLSSLDFGLALIGRNLRHLDIDQGSVINQSGEIAENPLSPDQLAFVPLQSKAISTDTKADFRDELSRINRSSDIYKILGLKNNKWIEIGVIKLESNFIASKFGDEQLFFRHKQ